MKIDILSLLPVHRRWRGRVSAFVDGELNADGAARAAAHLDQCVRCRALVEDLRALKQLTASLPAVAPPRSFQLTRAMVAGVRAVPLERAPARSAQAFLWAAQATAVVAAIGFVAVAVTALGGGGGDSSTTASRLSDESDSKRAPQGAESSADATAGGGAPAATQQPTLPAFSGRGVEGASTTDPPGSPAPASPEAREATADFGYSSTAAPATAVEDTLADPATPTDSDGSGRWIAAAAFAGVALVATTASLGMRVRRRRVP